MIRRSKEFLLFSSPAILVLLMISIYPLIRAILLSLQNVDLRRPLLNEFVGLTNYVRLVSDRRFFNSLKVSLVYSTATLSCSMLLGLALAFFVHESFKKRLRNAILYVFLLPFVIPRVSAALMWKFMYSPLIGVYNYFLIKLGAALVPFLSNPKLALPSIVIVDAWQWSFFIATLIASSIELVPTEPIEAAKIDGANKLQIIIHITIPYLKPSLLFIVFIKWVESLRAFDLIFNMTRGGPGIVTETMDLYAYSQGIAVAGEISYASSMAIVMLILTNLIITLVTKKWIKK